MGIGYNQTDPIESPHYLQKSDFHVISDEECEENLYRSTKNQLICLREEGTISCRGDSGGPVFFTVS